MNGRGEQKITLVQHLLGINRRIMAAVLAAFALIVVASSFALGLSALLNAQRAQADVLAENLSASLIFRNAGDAAQLLRSLEHAPALQAAVVYDDTGKPFASYRTGLSGGAATTANPWERIDYLAAYLELSQPIRFKGQLLGSLYLRAGLNALYWQMLIQVMVIVVAALVALLFGQHFLRHLSRSALHPLAELTYLTEQVSRYGDFSLRAETGRIQELDTLASGFNVMLDEIRQRDRRLREHRDSLETLLQERTAAMEEARIASNAKTSFLANMSHEIRTPLNAVIGLTGLLQQTPLDHQQRDRLRKIEAAGQHLLTVINDILDLSKIEAGRMQLEDTDFMLDDILTQVRTLIADAAGRKGLSVKVESGDAPPCLRGDPTRLRQSLLNFAGNAVKFTERGGVIIRSRLEAVEGEMLRIRFEVEDTGIGIPLDRQASLFAAFAQGDASTTRKYGGTGLGLAITQRLAQLMGGEVGIISEPGKGSVFWFSARLRGGDPAAARQAAAGQTSEAGRSLDQFVDARLLLAEDNEINREVALDMLDAVGLKSDVARNGREAVEMFEAGKYQLILMDMQMPEMDGIAATKAIRRLPGGGEVPIIAMTANAFEEDRKSCLAAGMNAFITKPVAPATLYSMLGRWLPAHDAAPGAVAGQPAVPVEDHALRSRLSEIKALDLARGLLVTSNKCDFLAHLLISFSRVHADDPRLIRRFIAENDWSGLAKLAHTLKGALATIGIVGISELAAEVQKAARENDGASVAPAAEKLAGQLAVFFGEVHAVLDSWDEAAGTP